MAIQTYRAVPSKGTTNISTLATDNVSADSRIQGRAFPARERVRSMSCPTMRLAATISAVETSCSTDRKPAFRPSTSPRYACKKLVKMPEESMAPKGPMK